MEVYRRALAAWVGIIVVAGSFGLTGLAMIIAALSTLLVPDHGHARQEVFIVMMVNTLAVLLLISYAYMDRAMDFVGRYVQLHARLLRGE